MEVKNMPAVSVIVPVYNVEKYLSRCIDSILAQTFTDFELILVDDGSTDKSGGICDDYKSQDNRIVVIHQNNQGQAVARNRAIDLSRGEYIAFIDSDDYVHPDMFLTLIRIITETKSDIVLFGYIEGKEERFCWERIEEAHYQIYDGKTFLKDCILSNKNGCWILCDKLFDRNCFNEIRLPVGRIFEDNAIVYKILYETNRVSISDAVLYYYYQNENSTTNQAFSEKNVDWLVVLEEMIAFFESNNDTDVCFHLVNRYINESVWIYKKLFEGFPDSKRIDYIKKQLRSHYRKDRKFVPITIKNSPELFHIIYPKCSKVYWFLRAVEYKMKG